MFHKIIVNSEVIVKSSYDPDDKFWRKLVKSDLGTVNFSGSRSMQSRVSVRSAELGVSP